MAIRVIARIRPQHGTELESDVIVSTGSNDNESALPNLIQIPNPKNEGEAFSFQLSSIYGPEASQQDISDREIYPTIKHLFGGSDVTIFAYGSTGAGKTHTMRGGKSLTERGIIPRFLSGIYRRARKIVKDSNGLSKVKVSLSYYEIYNDKVFDLLEPPEMRSAAGLPLRDNGAKTLVVGLTEKPCKTLTDFERLYEKANINRSTSATKMNAASSRSHAILGIRVEVVSGDEVRVGVASAIDLAGSEDNRRTGNCKERMVESASINKSLFTLAKCVEAINRNHSRIPYRESKMTRILSLGQNNGLTIMILNLAPTRAFHQDTLNSLKFANRANKIEVRGIENEPRFKGCSRPVPRTIQRQPLRPLANTVHNVAINVPQAASRQNEKPKAFVVYSDKATLSHATAWPHQAESIKRSSPLKRPLDSFHSLASRPPKRRRSERLLMRIQPAMSKQAIEDLVERKVTDIITAKEHDQVSTAPELEISGKIRQRLELLEQKIQGTDDGTEEGLTFLLFAKQHAARGEDGSALKMFTLAKRYFPNNKKLDQKIEKIRDKLQLTKQAGDRHQRGIISDDSAEGCRRSMNVKQQEDPTQEHKSDSEFDGGVIAMAENKKPVKTDQPCSSSNPPADEGSQTPCSRRLLDIINTRNVAQIRLLRGIGLKKAEGIVEALCTVEQEEALTAISSLAQLSQLKGIGVRTVEKMRASVQPEMVD